MASARPASTPLRAPELEPDEQAVEQQALQRQQGEREEREDDDLAVGQAGHADEQEESDEEGFLQSPQRVEQLLCLRVVREQAAEHQSTELAAQSERFEADSSREREADAEKQQHLPVAGDVEKAVEETARGKKREQRDGPRRRSRTL